MNLIAKLFLLLVAVLPFRPAMGQGGAALIEARHPAEGVIVPKIYGVADVYFYWRELSQHSFKTRLDISGSRTFKKVIYSRIIDGNRFVWLNRKTGLFYYRLSVIGDGGAVIQQTEIRGFKVLPPPSLVDGPMNEIIEYSSRRPIVSLDVNPLEDVLYHRYKISKEPRFDSPIVNIDSKELSYTASELGDGVYYWKVGTKYSLYLPIQYSETHKFTIKKGKPLPAPPIANKAIEDKVFSASEPVKLEWPQLEGTRVWVVEIASNEAFRGSQKAFVSSNGFEKQMPSGKYYWRIKGLSQRGDQSLWSRADHFEVK